MTAPQEAYEQFLQRISSKERELRSFVGTPEVTESLVGLRRELASLTQMPLSIEKLKEERREIAVQIHELLTKEARQHAELYAPLQQAMDHQGVAEEYRLSVATGLVESNLAADLLDTMINRQVSGSFSGVAESQRELDKLIAGTDFNDSGSVVRFADELELRLHHDYRQKSRPVVAVSTQLRRGVTPPKVYDKIFGLDYLSPRFGLTFGPKPIHQLSPGEKGTLLLIFFLLADLETLPLIVDQPEDNLDNQTVYRALVQAFRAAKARRQVIIVTHNPNLAVVCDADQLIIARMGKGGHARVTYESGGLENPSILRQVVDILEGTKPAFGNRSTKYALHSYGEGAGLAS